MDEGRPAPPPARLAGPLDDLLAGRTGPVLALLDEVGALPVHLVERLTWELATLYGRVAALPVVRQGDRRATSVLHLQPFRMTGGPPRVLEEADAFAASWKRLVRPPTRALHLEGLRRSLEELRAGDPHADALSAVLRHHTDLPVDLLEGRPFLRPEDGPAEARRLEGLLGGLVDLEPLLAAGRSSPSLARRDLCWRLDRLPAR